MNEITEFIRRQTQKNEQEILPERFLDCNEQSAKTKSRTTTFFSGSLFIFKQCHLLVLLFLLCSSHFGVPKLTMICPHIEFTSIQARRSNHGPSVSLLCRDLGAQCQGFQSKQPHIAAPHHCLFIALHPT